MNDLSYDMGNAGDLVKHGLLAEFVEWWCKKNPRALRFLDPFVGRPYASRPHPTLASRVRALLRCALRDAQPEPDARYYGSGSHLFRLY